MSNKSVLSSSLLLFLTLTLFSSNPSWAKGPLDGMAADYFDHAMAPILIKAKLCSSLKDCNGHEYFFCTSWDSLVCEVYGINDEQVVKELFLSMLNSGLRIGAVMFWSSKHNEKSFFEKPLLQFIDKTGGK